MAIIFQPCKFISPFRGFTAGSANDMCTILLSACAQRVHPEVTNDKRGYIDDTVWFLFVTRCETRFVTISIFSSPIPDILDYLFVPSGMWMRRPLALEARVWFIIINNAIFIKLSYSEPAAVPIKLTSLQKRPNKLFDFLDKLPFAGVDGLINERLCFQKICRSSYRSKSVCASLKMHMKIEKRNDQWKSVLASDMLWI